MGISGELMVFVFLFYMLLMILGLVSFLALVCSDYVYTGHLVYWYKYRSIMMTLDIRNVLISYHSSLELL